MMKVMAAIGRHLGGKEPKAGDVFGFRYEDAVVVVEFPLGGDDMKVTVAPITASFDEKMYKEVDE